uniref:Apple domain-containing protein n=1 Tax=Mucochytrium quahogii TaxID=96639 RepID=A0A7S2SFG6_9STRA|mmetsp:Transcript_5116/g.11266  ORF Transcript_5116/g.11266 Transcript_5116/m.11266 type:complete len:844 (+) Transcript_5116:996-3527(+)
MILLAKTPNSGVTMCANSSYTIVKTFESTYQCLRKTNETCSLRKMVENTYGIRKAIAELSCEMKASALDHSSCVEDILIKQNLDKCARTYILPEISQRRPCIQPDTITVGEGPKTRYVHDVKTVNECNFQCAREPGCTNWVFNSNNESCILKQNQYNTSLRDLVAAVRLPKAGFTSGLLCDDPSHEINMTEYSVHQECLHACDKGADWDKCYDKMRNRLPDQPPICSDTVDPRCLSCKNSFVGVEVPENLAAVRIKRECGAECEEGGDYRLAMSCYYCKQNVNVLELKLGTQTIATPFNTSSKRVSEFQVGGMYIGADPENAWDFAYVDQTVTGFDAATSVTTVATIEECRFRCQMSRTCEFFVFSISDHACALKTGAPHGARTSKPGSFIGTKYKGITCGSRIHTQMQTFNQSFETARLDISNRFPVCSQVCQTYTDFQGQEEGAQALQMLFVDFPPLAKIFGAGTDKAGDEIHAVFTDSLFSHHFAIYFKSRFYGMVWPLLYPEPIPWYTRRGTLVPLIYAPRLMNMLIAVGKSVKPLYWAYNTLTVTDCYENSVWTFPALTPSRDLGFPWANYRLRAGFSAAAPVRRVIMGDMGTDTFRTVLGARPQAIVCPENLDAAAGSNQAQGSPDTEGPSDISGADSDGAQSDPEDPSDIDDAYLQMENAKCEVCCVHSPLMGIPPKRTSCTVCRREGLGDPLPGFPILKPVSDPLCMKNKVDPNPEKVDPLPIPLPKCYPEPRKVGISGTVFSGSNPLCRHENLNSIIRTIVLFGFVAAAGCMAADVFALGVCETATSGCGTPVCVAEAAAFSTICSQIVAADLTISTVGRAIGCPEFSGSCTAI